MKLYSGDALQLAVASYTFLDIAAASFTPKDLLSEPRRTPAIPNPSGTRALFSTSTYSFDSHTRTTTFNLLDISNGKNSTILADVTSISEAVWLGVGDAIGYVVSSDEPVKGGSELWVYDGASKYKAASFPAAVSNLKTKSNNDTSRSINFVVTASAFPNGTIYNPETAPKKYSSGRVYTSLFVRHWDTYIEEWRNAIFAGSLTLNDKGRWTQSSDKLVNLLADSGLESPVPPFGDSGDYDLNVAEQKVAFLAKDPELPPANNTASYIYIADISASSKPKPINKPKSKGDPAGASASPSWSPDGKRIAFLQMTENGYESDRNRIYVAGLDGKVTGLALDWDRSPSKVSWSRDGKYLYLSAEEYGREKLWILPADAAAQGKVFPQPLTQEGSVSDFRPISDNSVLISSTSLVSPTFYSVLKINKTSAGNLNIVFSPKNSSKTGSATLSPQQVSDFWVTRKDGVKIHGWIIKPSFFDPSKKYPLAYFIHGGPQGAWTDSWSSRWNPAVFAERGYVIVAVNPTGSTGYGKKFTDDIRTQWGGAPYTDLELAYDHVVKTYKFLDASRAVALGASYGGYMINWIQGNPLGRRFKALVCHDGVFNTLTQYSSEELWFPNHDFGGTFIDVPEQYNRWNPSTLVKNWATPMMVIHNELDYRLPISEGLAMFNVLQTKGVPSKFLTFPDENHWVLRPENSLVWHTEVISWINKWAGL
ncbi:Alpha/Beta hydrolase protein [Peziza echinospora]|nr:Alpha/Beta hydrolase protein [Peziza echinospora]